MLVKAPKHGRYNKKDGVWKNDNVQKYQTYWCKECKVNRVQTYCTCRIAHWLCNGCYLQHRINVVALSPTSLGHDMKSYAKHHSLVTAPPGARTYDPNLGWMIHNKDERQKYFCTICKNTRIRTVCSCDMTKWMCWACNVEHVVDVLLSSGSKQTNA